MSLADKIRGSRVVPVAYAVEVNHVTVPTPDYGLGPATIGVAPQAGDRVIRTAPPVGQRIRGKSTVDNPPKVRIIINGAPVAEGTNAPSRR